MGRVKAVRASHRLDYGVQGTGNREESFGGTDGRTNDSSLSCLLLLPPSCKATFPLWEIRQSVFLNCCFGVHRQDLTFSDSVPKS